MTRLRELELFGVREIRFMCGDYGERIGFDLWFTDGRSSKDVCVLSQEIEAKPDIFPEVLIFPEVFPETVDKSFSMRKH